MLGQLANSMLGQSANILVLLTLWTVYVSLCIHALLLYCTTTVANWLDVYIRYVKTTVIKYFYPSSAVLCFTQNIYSITQSKLAFKTPSIDKKYGYNSYALCKISMTLINIFPGNNDTWLRWSWRWIHMFHLVQITCFRTWIHGIVWTNWMY